ncbi:hypothetical protein ABZV25_14275, partial [Micrococcus luteus]
MERSRDVVDLALSPHRAIPQDLLVAVKFATRTLTLGTQLGRRTLTTEAGKALLTGVAAHAVGRLPSLADIVAHGGTFHTGCKIDDLRQPQGTKVVLFDTAPKGLPQAAGELLPARYARH